MHYRLSAVHALTVNIIYEYCSHYPMFSAEFHKELQVCLKSDSTDLIQGSLR